MLDRRDFVKSVAAIFAAAPILPSLDLVKQHLGEVDNDSFDAHLRELPVLREKAESIIKQASFEDIIQAAHKVMKTDIERFGFSYQKIYEKVKIQPGEIPKFPLDLLAFHREKNGLTTLNVNNPIVFLDENKNVVIDNDSVDYVLVPQSDFEGDWINFEFSNMIGKWDRVSMWVQEIAHSMRKKMAKGAWDVLMAASKQNTGPTIEDFTDVQRTIGICKTAMRRNDCRDSSSPFRNRATDIFVPTHTYYKMFEQVHIEKDILNCDKSMCVLGVKVNHAPELSWYEPEKDFGVVLDLGTRDSFINTEITDPTVFHRNITPYKGQGMVWNTEGFAILNANKVMLAA